MIRRRLTSRISRAGPPQGWGALVAAVCALLAAPAGAQLALDELPDPAKGVDLVERLGQRVPPQITVRSAAGEVIDLRADLFEGSKPAILTMVYYDCPLMCPLVLERLVQAIDSVKYKPGEDFNVVVVSFDPTNTDEMAREARDRAISQYSLGMPEGAGPMTEQMKAAFRFHTASGGNARKLGDAIGFRYKELPNGEYSHPAALIVMSPKGKVSRYLNIDNPGDEAVEMALLKASRGGISTGAVDWFKHVCFAWDPSQGAYTLQAMRVMQLGAALTVVLLGGLIGALFLRGRLRRASPTNTPSTRASASEPIGRRHATGYSA